VTSENTQALSTSHIHTSVPWWLSYLMQKQPFFLEISGSREYEGDNLLGYGAM
jgi:hypothetical protein